MWIIWTYFLQLFMWEKLLLFLTCNPWLRPASFPWYLPFFSSSFLLLNFWHCYIITNGRGFLYSVLSLSLKFLERDRKCKLFFDQPEEYLPQKEVHEFFIISLFHYFIIYVTGLLIVMLRTVLNLGPGGPFQFVFSNFLFFIFIKF